MHICAWDDGKGLCYGDQGGPLIVEDNGHFTLVGISSWVVECDKLFPDVYSRVTARLDWIRANTQGSQDTSCATTTTASSTTTTAMTTASSTTATAMTVTLTSTAAINTASTTTAVTTTTISIIPIIPSTTSTSSSQNLRCRNSRTLGKEMQIVLNYIFSISTFF